MVMPKFVSRNALMLVMSVANFDSRSGRSRTSALTCFTTTHPAKKKITSVQISTRVMASAAGIRLSSRFTSGSNTTARMPENRTGITISLATTNPTMDNVAITITL
jgi:hypothetical protein